MMTDLRPIGSFGSKHGPDAPSRAKHVQGFRKAVVVNNSGVDRKYPHEKYDVATGKHHVEHLQWKKNHNSSSL